MKHRVKRKQPNSKMCLVCGLKNHHGLKARFYELENNELIAVFSPLTEHQSYPGRLHGGITMAILDETIGRAIQINHDEEMWGVTVEFKANFRKPIPLGEELKVVGRITKETSRSFEGSGEIILKNGDIAARGTGKYLRLPLSKIVNFNPDEQEWKVTASDQDPQSIEL